jgi:hypothetical protein
MADQYAAFISYTHRDHAWVSVIQENLERCLERRSQRADFRFSASRNASTSLMRPRRCSS